MEAFADRERRGWFNRRRREDPLVVKLSASWPYTDEYSRISQAVLAWPRTS